MQNISSQVPVNYFSKENYAGLKILDACAAPGGKASQLSALYPDAIIYAFEPQKVRYDKMKHNFKKLGCENIQSIHDEIRNI
jgi:16S rRNA C967 or C1407 C5-methylase (RsmB/RsmF family)